MAGDATPFTEAPFFWSEQYDRRIQFLGRPAGDDEVGTLGRAFNEMVSRYWDRISQPAQVLQSRPYARLLRDEPHEIIGIHDASLGARSNETSGRAIMARHAAMTGFDIRIPFKLREGVTGVLEAAR